jgi:hyperosmotically inducible protein
MIDKGKQAPGNNKLAEELYDAFHKEKEFSGYDINVTAHGGQVNLQGIVDVMADVHRAVNFAKAFPGVDGVENDLTVSSDGAIDDDDVYLEVTQELGSDPAVNEENIHFTVQHGVVSLLGEADSQEERDRAFIAASKARGVRTINNQIRIR